MTEEKKSIEEIQKEIDELVVEFKQRSDAIHNSAYDSEFTLLEIGKKLSAISIDMTEKEFKQYKSETATNLDFEKSSLDKVVKISRNRAISDNKDNLPAGWATLYLLCQIEPKDFDDFMRESEVNKSTTRTDLRQMVDTFKANRPDIYPVKNPIKKKEKLSIQQMSIKSKNSENFIPLLNDFLSEHSWELVTPKEKQEQE
jgi:hypothetical protein